MIPKPVVGMRVYVDDAMHCFRGAARGNTRGPGTIMAIDGNMASLVQGDGDGDPWWRCKKCISELKEENKP